MMSDTQTRQQMGQESLRIITKHDSETILQQYETKYQEAIKLHTERK
jgi:hypothetical protein